MMNALKKTIGTLLRKEQGKVALPSFGPLRFLLLQSSGYRREEAKMYPKGGGT